MVPSGMVGISTRACADRITRPVQVATVFARGCCGRRGSSQGESVRSPVARIYDVPFPVERFKFRNPLVPTGVRK